MRERPQTADHRPQTPLRSSSYAGQTEDQKIFVASFVASFVGLMQKMRESGEFHLITCFAAGVIIGLVNTASKSITACRGGR